MIKDGVEYYIDLGANDDEDAYKSLTSAKKMTSSGGGRKQALINRAYILYLKAAENYEKAAKLEENLSDISELYHWALNSTKNALEIKEDEKTRLISERYKLNIKNLEEKISEKNNHLEKTISIIILSISFIFGFNLISHNITGSTIASGNTLIDFSVGLIILTVVIMGIFFLFKKNFNKFIYNLEKKNKSKHQKKQKYK